MTTDQTAGEQPAMSKKKFILIIASAVLLVVTLIGASLFIAGGGDSDDSGQGQTAATRGAPRYIDLDPTFTVNLDQDSTARFLKISVSLLAYEDEVEEAITQHKPQIRSKLLLLFSGKRWQELGSAQGRQQLRDEAFTLVQNIVKQYTQGEGAEALFFTHFVMQ